jgi:hypothetical protein
VIEVMAPLTASVDATPTEPARRERRVSGPGPEGAAGAGVMTQLSVLAWVIEAADQEMLERRERWIARVMVHPRSATGSGEPGYRRECGAHHRLRAHL